MNIQCFLFDLDGTLVLTGGAGLRGFRRAYKEVFKIDEALESISPAGKTDPAILIEVCCTFLQRDPTPEETKDCFHKYLTYLKEELRNSNRFQVLPGIQPLLEWMHNDERCLVGLGTGNLEEGAKAKLQFPGLWNYFQFGGFGSDAMDRTRLLEMARERAKERLKPGDKLDETWVIGDTPKDIHAGKAIGAKTVGVATGPYSVQQLKESDPDLVYDDLSAYEGFLSDVGLLPPTVD